MAPLHLADEPARLRALDRYDIIGAPPLPDLDSVVELAAYVCGVPNAVVNIIGEYEQHQVAATGFEPGVCAREDSMCAVTIAQPEPVYVTDAREDPRFADNPFVTGKIDNLRFYAASQLRAPDGHVLGTLCTFDTDVHELTPAQREGLDKLARVVVDVLELRRHGALLTAALSDVDGANRELARSNAALRAFADQVSHDLKNPLTGILAFVAMLAESPAVAGDKDATWFADRALSGATRMWTMIEGVLSHASAGGRPHLGQVALAEVVAQVREDLERAAAAAGATVTAEDPLPIIVGDAIQLRILLQNLVANSIKFRSPDRPCRVHVSASDVDGATVLSVADNGVGIAPADRERVTEMFTRLGTDVDGTGIGLATCRRIAEAHGGSLTIGDTPAGGTTVTVRLPALGIA